MARRVPGTVVRYGVIGLGGMGQGHCKSIAAIPHAALAAVCDSHGATAAAVGKEYGVSAWTTPSRLIASGACDAVLVSTPHPVRPPIVLKAMRAGLHVLSEKPLSEKVSTADRMLATARETGVAFAVMFQRRTRPVIQKAREIVERGELGEIRRTAMFCPEYRSQAYYDHGGWRATWVGEGGGVLINQAPHLMDMFVSLGGVPVWVDGRVATRMHRIDVEDHAEALLRYANGATGYVYCSTNEPAPGERLEIVGDKGKLVYEDDILIHYVYEPSLAEFTAKNTDVWAAPKVRKRHVRASAAGSHRLLIENFTRHLLKGEPLLSPAEEALGSLELANAILLSADRGKAVKLPVNRRAYDAFLARKRREFPSVRQVEDKRITDPRGR